MKRISLVLVDNNSSAQDGIGALIRAQPGFQILAASAKLAAAMGQVRESKPDLVLLHLRPPGDEGLTVAGTLQGELPETRVIIVGLEPLHEDLAGFIRAGVSGFIMGNASMDRFLNTIHSVARGIQVLPPELTHALFGQLAGYGVRKRPNRTLDVKRLPGYGRVEVAAWSLKSSLCLVGFGLTPLPGAGTSSKSIPSMDGFLLDAQLELCQGLSRRALHSGQEE